MLVHKKEGKEQDTLASACFLRCSSVHLFSTTARSTIGRKEIKQNSQNNRIGLWGLVLEIKKFT
jgi:hypothetical protein